MIGSGAAQNSRPAATDEDSGAAVRLETHNGQTRFKLGDRVMVDLVFTSRTPGYVVNTDAYPYRPVSDLAEVVPAEGWVRTYRTFRGQGQDGSALATLGTDPLRVPVLLNRTIAFQKPGHYEVKLTTERLRTAATFMNTTSAEACDPCRTTNTVGIDLSARSAREESALVVSLSRELEDPKEQVAGIDLSAKEKKQILQDIENQQKMGDSTEAGQKQMAALLRKMNDIVANQLALSEKGEQARRLAAERLAYLIGDDAVQAKVRFIVADKEDGEAHPIGPIMVDGLPTSRNKQLQSDLLEAAWRDPQHIPTSVLQTAVREARELIHKQMVTDEPTLWAGTSEEHQAALDEYHREIDEIAATLLLRSEANRAETIKFLKTRGAPNQFQ
jgi:hypothetical protein